LKVVDKEGTAGASTSPTCAAANGELLEGEFDAKGEENALTFTALAAAVVVDEKAEKGDDAVPWAADEKGLLKGVSPPPPPSF